MERAAPRREGLLKLKFGTVCTSTLFARITVRLIELSVLWAHAAHTGSSFLVKRKEPKIHKEPLGSLTSNRRGQCPLSTPPEELETFVTGGSVTALRLLRGRSPQGISKGKPLRYAFGYFSRKRKVSAGVGCVSPQKLLCSFWDKIANSQKQQ